MHQATKAERQVQDDFKYAKYSSKSYNFNNQASTTPPTSPSTKHSPSNGDKSNYKKTSTTTHAHVWKTPREKRTYFSFYFERVCARERHLRTDRIQTLFRCVSTETTINNTNVMPCENKGREYIRVLSHGYWVKNICYLLSRCNARALLLVK